MLWVAREDTTASPGSCALERLYARQRSKYRVATTDSRHGGPIAPNHLRGLAVQRLDQVWATDATCVLTGQGWLYLVAVLDLFSRRVIGWAMRQILDAPLSSPLCAWLSPTSPYSATHHPLRSRPSVRQRRLPADT